jgi:hypothetical protein
MAQRDFYQRKAYALRRMTLAVHRLHQATSEVDRENAKCWVKIWSAVSGVRQFKLSKGGGSIKK